MKHSQSVEIAYLINGGVVSERRLSRAGEVRAAVTAFALVAGLSLARRGHGRGGAGRRPPGRLRNRVHGALGAGHRRGGDAGGGSRRGAGALLQRRRRTSMTTRSGASGCRSVQRTPGGYVLRLTPGMTGRLEEGRAPIPVESLGEGAVDFRFAPDARAELSLGVATFVIRNAPAEQRRAEVARGDVAALRAQDVAAARSSRRWPACLCAVPAGARLSEADMKSAIPANATPWEVEKALRERGAGAGVRRCTSASMSCRSPARGAATSASAWR